jgi:hypothetical protein
MSGDEAGGRKSGELAVDAVEALGKLAVNLWRGYGYSFYRAENELREDDQRVRRIAGELLKRARRALSDAEGAYRREMIPPPSRAQPFPPAEVQAAARRLEALAAAVAALDARIAQAPVPATDWMTRRYRDEKATLERLADADLALVEAAQALCASVEGQGHAALLARAGEIEGEIAAIAGKLTARASLLV